MKCDACDTHILYFDVNTLNADQLKKLKSELKHGRKVSVSVKRVESFDPKDS